MNRIEIKDYAKSKIQNNLLTIWKNIIIAFGISVSFNIVMAILFNKMNTDYLDILINILMFPLEIGMINFFVNFCEDKTFEAKDLFKHYKNFLKIVGVMLLTAILVMLGYICFLIPGIILTFSYMLVPVVLIKKTELSIIETLKYSREKMNGHKMDAFVLGLSFIGWTILGVLTLGILYIWLYPYMSVTFTKFYLDVLGE